MADYETLGAELRGYAEDKGEPIRSYADHASELRKITEELDKPIQAVVKAEDTRPLRYHPGLDRFAARRRAEIAGPSKEPPFQLPSASLRQLITAPYEAIANVGADIGAQIGSGYAGLAGTILPGAQGQGDRWQHAVQSAQTYSTQNPIAQMMLRPVAAGTQALLVDPSRVIGDKIEAAGFPAAGAMTSGLIQALPFAGSAPATLAARVGRGVANTGDVMRGLRQPPSTVTIAQEGATTAIPANGMVSVGAAAPSHTESVRAAYEASTPEAQANLRSIPPRLLSPEIVERANKFARVGINPTEGELFQHPLILADEWNARAEPHPIFPNNPKMENPLMERFRERNPKILSAFDRLRENAAPESYSPTQTARSNSVLEALKRNYDAREANIHAKYQDLVKANGGELPIDAKSWAIAAENALKENYKWEGAPANLKNAIERHKDGEPMNFRQYEALRTDTAAYMRGANHADRAAAYIVRQELENLPLKGDVSDRLKPLADAAREANREQASMLNPNDKNYNPAYAAAAADMRTAEEILHGDEHPASRTFLDKHLISKASNDVAVERMLNEIGRNTPAHHDLIAALIEDSKNRAVNGKGEVLHAKAKAHIDALGKRLDQVVGREAADELRNIIDVAKLTSHDTSLGHVNRSGTQTATQRNAMLDAAKDIGLSGMEGALAVGTKGLSTVPVKMGKIFFKERAQEAAAIKRLEEMQRSTNPFETLRRGENPAANINRKTP